MRKCIVLMILLVIAFLAKSQSNKVAIAKIKGEEYKAVYNDKGNLTILNHKGKVVFFLRNKDLYNEDFWRLKFEDFNGDGYKDLVIDYRSNVPDRRDLILFDRQLTRFIQVKDFPEYPAAIRLKGTDLFYSYHRSGCADEDWDSDLFKIENSKIVKIGNINGQACVDPPDKPFIHITRFIGNHELLVKKYPLARIDDFEESKWGFIKWYWEHNYKKFRVSN